jgi:phosphoribosylformylglycinamidine (FGAM) synthase-like amidotransferase family enzyme
VLSSSGTSVIIRATRRNIREDAILNSHRREKTSNLTEISQLQEFHKISLNYQNEGDERNVNGSSEHITAITERRDGGILDMILKMRKSVYEKSDIHSSLGGQ